MTPEQWNERAVTMTMIFFVVSVTLAMLYGLFDTRVDNDLIFKLLAPPLQRGVRLFHGRRGK